MENHIETSTAQKQQTYHTTKTFAKWPQDNGSYLWNTATLLQKNHTQGYWSPLAKYLLDGEPTRGLFLTLERPNFSSKAAPNFFSQVAVGVRKVFPGGFENGRSVWVSVPEQNPHNPKTRPDKSHLPKGDPGTHGLPLGSHWPKTHRLYARGFQGYTHGGPFPHGHKTGAFGCPFGSGRWNTVPPRGGWGGSQNRGFIRVSLGTKQHNWARGVSLKRKNRLSGREISLSATR